MTGVTDRFITVVALFLALPSVLFIGCAEVGPPPGGEVDRTAPYLIASHPENGATSVPIGDEIIFQFSEALVPPSSGKAVYISPRPTNEPKVRWKKDHLLITLADEFAPDQTYIVTVSSDVTDQRRNHLDSTVSIAFSTGTTIDSGSVIGRVLSGGTAAKGMVVALYDLAVLSDSVEYDSTYPTYVTTVGQQGGFRFQYLPDSKYQLIAFSDRNRDEWFNPYREQFALPDREIQVGGSLPLDNLVMSLTSQDSSSASILTVAGTGDGLVRIRLNKPISLSLLGAHPGNLLLRPTNDSPAVHPAQAILESQASESNIITGFFRALAEGMYDIELTHDVDLLSLTHDSAYLVPVEDRTPPTVVEFQPDSRPRFVDLVQIQLGFSEPIDTTRLTDQTFVLWEDDLPVLLESQWIDRFHLRLEPDELHAGASYRLDITEFDINDLAGNRLGDSLISYSFATLDDDSLGSVSGELVISLPDRADARVVLTLESIEGHQSFDHVAKSHRFYVNLPPGKYLLSGFIDQDMDEERFDGSIFPFRLAETRSFYPDTIAVRARFETAGIVFEFK